MPPGIQCAHCRPRHGHPRAPPQQSTQHEPGRGTPGQQTVPLCNCPITQGHLGRILHLFPLRPPARSHPRGTCPFSLQPDRRRGGSAEEARQALALPMMPPTSNSVDRSPASLALSELPWNTKHMLRPGDSGQTAWRATAVSVRADSQSGIIAHFLRKEWGALRKRLA